MEFNKLTSEQKTKAMALLRTDTAFVNRTARTTLANPQSLKIRNGIIKITADIVAELLDWPSASRLALQRAVDGCLLPSGKELCDHIFNNLDYLLDSNKNKDAIWNNRHKLYGYWKLVKQALSAEITQSTTFGNALLSNHLEASCYDFDDDCRLEKLQFVRFEHNKHGDLTGRIQWQKQSGELILR